MTMRCSTFAAGVVLLVLGGTTLGANVGPAGAVDAVRCPASGEAIDDATSDAPLRHTQAELEPIYQAVVALIPTPPAHSAVMAAGYGRDTLDIGLAPGQEVRAEQLVQSYGDAVRIYVGGRRYVPRGCGPQPAAPRCRALVGAAPATAELRLRVIVDTPVITASESGDARLIVRNRGAHRFAIDSGVPIVGTLVKPGTKQVVSTYSFVIGGVGGGVNLDPGESESIAVVFGAERCGAGTSSALPPGRYGLRVVLKPEGPEGKDLKPVLLSPETVVKVRHP